MNPADNLERSIRQFQVTTSIETDRRILNDAFAALEESTREESAEVEPVTRRMIAFPKVLKLAAVAAVVLIAFALLFKARLPGAIELHQIYGALQKTENVCVSSYTPGQAEPIQQVWKSRPLKIVMYRSQTGAQARFDLFDISNRLKKTRYLTSDAVSSERLAAEAVIRVERSMGDVFELVPFSDMTSAPKGSHWSKVPDKDTGASIPGTKVYELTWPVETFSYKCRIFVDAKSNLPKRTEYFFKGKAEDQFQLESTQVATYPTETEIKLLIRETFGPDLGRAVEPGYIGTPAHRPAGTVED